MRAKVTVTPSQLEAAAKALYAGRGFYESWQDVGESVRSACYFAVRPILEAAGLKIVEEDFEFASAVREGPA